MKTVLNISNFSSKEKTFVTIGIFDGVHFGHQKIIKKLVTEAKKENKKSVLITFFPHPRMILEKNSKIELINTIEEKKSLLKKTNLDYLIIHPFSIEFSKTTALEFVRDLLVNQLNISKLIIGHDHHFGKNREGNITQLTEYTYLYDFVVEEIPAQDINDISVSSTEIRHALFTGNLETANKYLGYYFTLTGNVVKGIQLGSKIGFPTANISVDEDYKLIPKTGVYIVRSLIGTKIIYGITNIGNRPTIGGKNKTIEVHFFDFNQNLYAKSLTIEFIYFIRDEQNFESVEGLIEQIKRDEETARNYIKLNF